MKKTRWMMLLLAAVWASLLLGNTVMAKSVDEEKIYDLQPGKTVKMEDYVTSVEIYDEQEKEYVYQNTFNHYKMVIPADGYITVKMKAEYDDDDVWVYRKKRVYGGDNSRSAILNVDYQMIKRGENKFPISKGTYYLVGNRIISFSYTFTKTSFPTNYRRAKAQTLKRGKKAEICQVPKKNYSRWFKIKLTKKQAITFWSDQGSRVDIFDEDLHHVEVEHAGETSKKYFTREKMPKGTYYLRMANAWPAYLTEDGLSYDYYYTTLYWK